MARPDPVRRLIVNADDFGRSRAINEAVIRAHTDGILTTASLMVNEPAAAEAISLAHEHPRLGVGLHLSLICGRSALPPKQIPGLVDDQGEFDNNPVAAGFKYFARRALREPLRKEIRAQLERFRSTGLTLDHVNGHLHLHLHPTVFPLIMAEAEDFGIKRMRLTRDPFRLNARLASGRWFYRISHAIIYSWLSARTCPEIQRSGIRHTDRVFGLLQNARADEDYILRLLLELPAGDSELYSHPSLDEFKHEFDALISPRVKDAIQREGVKLIRYQDL